MFQLISRIKKRYVVGLVLGKNALAKALHRSQKWACIAGHTFSKQVTYSLSSYLSRLGCSLGELPLFGLTNFVRPNTWKTKKQYIYLQTGYGYMHDSSPTYICQIINPAPCKVVEAGFDIARLTTKKFFHQFLFVNKFKLGNSKPQEGYQQSDCQCRFVLSSASYK